MKRKSVLFLMSIVLIIVFTVCVASNCTGKTSSVGENKESNHITGAVNVADIKIGYIVKTLGNTFWQTYEAGARAAAKDLGIKLDVRDVPTESDFKAQLDVAMTMVNQDYNAIVAASITNTNLIPAIAEANRMKIPWIVVSEEQDTDVLKQSNAFVTAQCRLSFYDEGIIAGKYVAKELRGAGQVAIIEGMAGTSATRDRIAGFTDAIADYPNIKIVASQPADWMRERAHDVTASILQANPDIQAIYALNDTMALGVVAAIEQAGKSGIIIVGDDGTQEAFQSIKEGKMSATIDGVAWQIAYYSVHAAVKAAVEKTEILPNYDLTPGLVTKDNVQEAIDLAPKPVQEMFEINKNIYLPIPGIKK
jgi:ABC-type sugar transport system substrate-binding protein